MCQGYPVFFRSFFDCTIVTMNLVADTNVFLAVALNEPERGHIIEVTSDAVLSAPEILPYEIGNALSAMIKRGRISKAEALDAEKTANLIPVRLVSIDIRKALELAIERNIYAYDAYFLLCARSLAQSLISLDGRMKQVARDLGIDVLE